MREMTLAPNEAVFPEWIDGVQHWLSPEVKAFTDKLHYGDGASWQGDTRLALYFDGAEQRWLIMRLEADNELRLFCRSQPNAPLDESLFQRLAERDTRNGFDPVKFLASQEQAQQALEDEQVAATREVLNKVVQTIAKSNGVV